MGRKEVFAYVKKGEYPKLSYILLPETQHLPEIAIAKFDDDLRRKFGPILKVLAANPDYMTLRVKQDVYEKVQSALIQLDIMLRRSVAPGTIIGRSQRVIVQKLSLEIERDNFLLEGLRKAGVQHIAPLSHDQISQIIQELFNRDLIRTESCVIAFPSRKFEQLKREIETTDKRLDQMWEEVAQQLKNARRIAKKP